MKIERVTLDVAGGCCCRARRRLDEDVDEEEDRDEDGRELLEELWLLRRDPSGAFPGSAVEKTA